MSVESPVVKTSAVSTDQPEAGQQKEVKSDGSIKDLDTPTTSAVAEQSTEDQNSTAATDDAGKNDDAVTEEEKDGETSRWIGKRLERAKAKEREAAKAEIEYWKNVAAGKTAQTNTPAPVQQAVQAGKPNFSDYQDIESFTDALTDWKIEQKLTQQNQQAHMQQVHNTYQQRVAEFAKKAPDFEKVVGEFISTYQNENVPELNTVVFESDVGPAIVHYLAKSETEMERILSLPSHRRIIELGKLEDKLKGNVATVVKEPKVSKAPAPITKETGSAVVAKSILDKDLTMAEHRALREQQKKRF